MEPSKKEMLRQRQLTFIGKMLASFPHSIRNNLATIRESAGWLGDLLRQEGQGIENDREKFAGILSTIERQVKILAQKSHYLNRFAQRMDRTLSTFNPVEIIEEAVSFSTRFARIREVSLRSEMTETLPSIYGDPVRTHFLVSIAINDMLERVDIGGKIIVRAKPIYKGVLIEVEGYGTSEALAPPPDEGDQYWSTGQQVVADLGGRLETTAIGHNIRRTSLFLPNGVLKIQDNS